MARVRRAAKIKRPPAPPAPHFEVTPERLAHANENSEIVKATIDKAGERALLTRRFADSHIDRMRKRGWITEAQWYAAIWYRDRHEEAGFGSPIVAKYGDAGGGGVQLNYGLPRTERQARARLLWRQGREQIVEKSRRTIDAVVLYDEMPALRNGRQRERFAGHIGRMLQPLAEWLRADMHQDCG